MKIDLLLFLVVACVGYAVTEDTSSTHLPTPTSPTATASSSTVESTSSSAASTTASITTDKPTSTATSVQTSHLTSPSAGPTSEAPTTPKPSENLWSVWHNGTYCILLKAEISIDFKYISSANNQTNTSSISVPTYMNTTFKGSCDPNHQWIEIGFFSNWALKFDYEKTHDGKYYQSEVSLKWDLEEAHLAHAPNISGVNHNTEPMFNTSKAGYLCLARMTLYNNASVENGLLAIYTKSLQLEAFQTKSTATLSDQYERCKEDTISNLVPIIVGACLGGLIIIVLIAYLIGRKRSRRGYESV